jgi:dTMP kinase
MKIISFEGIDGTGKSVQMAELEKRLLGAGKKVKTLSFPMYDRYFGSYVGEYLTGKDGIGADDVDGKSMALWFALDRWEAFSLLGELPEIDFLLINRYVLSNAVYQSIRERDLDKPDITDFVVALEYEHFKIPRPDIQIILDVEPDSAAENVIKKGYREYVGEARDLYEAIPSIQERARQKYLTLAKNLPNAVIIPCMEAGKLLPITRIAENIWQAVNGL